MAYPFLRENPFSWFPTSDILSPLALALTEESLVAPPELLLVPAPSHPTECPWDSRERGKLSVLVFQSALLAESTFRPECPKLHSGSQREREGSGLASKGHCRHRGQGVSEVGTP